MRISQLLAVALCLGTAMPASAGVKAGRHHRDAQEQAVYKKYFDHPKAEPVSTDEVRVEVSKDAIIRSCCAPPNLLVLGKLTNLSGEPIDYLKLRLVFFDHEGNEVYSESGYNQRAVTLGEDAAIAALLNEKPHFEPIPPGTQDQFNFLIPLPLIPRYQSVQVEVDEIARNAR